MEDGRRKKFLMEDGRRKSEEVRLLLHSTSCTSLPVSSLILQHHRICFGIVYRPSSYCDEAGQSNIKIPVLL